MKRLLFFLGLIIPLELVFFLPKEQAAMNEPRFWSVEAIDTMKYSRDPSREKLQDPSFDLIIAKQVQDIAKIGATHVAIATPYDDEFLPILKRWVEAARRNNLHVWFRGNWSGWEGWFGYLKINRAEHSNKTQEFILKHAELFENGDIFTGCPECENGGPGDPRRSGAGDVQAYRQFLIDEHNLMTDAFKRIRKNVNVDYNSMNGDVARLVMDRKTTKALGGTVVIDHYVRTPEQLVKDVQEIAQASHGNMILGEFGAPILDINGNMTEDEQAAWIKSSLEHLLTVPELTGVNYWVNLGGSTSIYNQDGTSRKAVAILSSFYHPTLQALRIINPLQEHIGNAQVSTLDRTYTARTDVTTVPFVQQGQRAIVSAPGYSTKYITLSAPQEQGQNTLLVVLEPTEENVLYVFKRLLKFLFRL